MTTKVNVRRQMVNNILYKLHKCSILIFREGEHEDDRLMRCDLTYVGR
jgi:hypothetical protein